MKRDLPFYFQFFWSTFLISAFTFGGGYVIITLMQKKFVDELGWIDQKEMMDLVAMAQSAPGVIAINASILIGYKLAGLRGCCVAVLATVLPPLLIISIISYFYNAFQESVIIQKLLAGMQIGVAAVILDVVYGMLRGIVRQRDLLLCGLMAVCFVAAYFFGVNAAYLILFCGLIGLLRGRLAK